ncbi:MBL fold metallo-hydrolase [Hathewaya massiliensis]|uniref:MBL fold metallo-hydrolase n=1 Tax=Hathewaya massiliensis TaxID=1964382 RepID=UPI00115A1922|nr:MBL fold metallo-hydrolase [Hathewaya massiliensis]
MEKPKLIKVFGYMYHLHKRNFKTYLKKRDIPNKKEELKYNSVHWIGHATTLINIEGKTIVTDPVTSPYLGQLKRQVEPSMDLSNLNIDYILISHGHMDHLDKNTMKKFNKDIPVICPKQYKSLLKLWGFKNLHLIMAGESFTDNNISIEAFRANHDGKRYAFGKHSPSNSYLIKSAKKSIFFAGDTAFTDTYKGIKSDISLMPVGCYFPSEFEKMHCNPYQSFEMFRMMDSKFMVPIHYKTYILAQDDDSKTLETLEKINDGTIKIIDIGETLEF